MILIKHIDDEAYFYDNVDDEVIWVRDVDIACDFVRKCDATFALSMLELYEFAKVIEVGND